MRETELDPGAGADARLHLALALVEDAGLLEEGLSFARSAERALQQVAEPDPTLELGLEAALARLSLRMRL